MKTAELLEKINIPRHKLYYLEQKGYINPKRFPRGDLEERKYSQSDFEKVETIWKYLQEGFKHRVAYQKAMEEIEQNKRTNVMNKLPPKRLIRQ